LSFLISFATVIVLFIIALAGAGAGLQTLFGIIFPYIAFFLFLGGLVYRVLGWANVPVPFRIPTTCGQERSLPWIKQARLDNPSSTAGVIGRMALEVLFFRSLTRNTRTELSPDGRLSYRTSLLLWLGAIVFHYSMLVIVIRHLRLFFASVPRFVTFVQDVDGFLQLGTPVYYITSFLFIGALLYLLGRRLTHPLVRYISLPGDYFPLMLLLGIGLSGFWLRYVTKTDVIGIKELVMGLVSFSPAAPVRDVAPLFYGHLFLVCVLLTYFPFSKLVHMTGVFLSPTRNLANTNRMAFHQNPWDYPVKVHTYEEYEDEFRVKMKGVGLPVEKE
jgi:nitrate reductase gamma subunit